MSKEMLSTVLRLGLTILSIWLTAALPDQTQRYAVMSICIVFLISAVVRIAQLRKGGGR